MENGITQQVLNAVIARYGAETPLGALTLEQVNEIMTDTAKLNNIRDAARVYYEAGLQHEHVLQQNSAPAEMIAAVRSMVETFYVIHQFSEKPYWMEVTDGTNG